MSDVYRDICRNMADAIIHGDETAAKAYLDFIVAARKSELTQTIPALEDGWDYRGDGTKPPTAYGDETMKTIDYYKKAIYGKNNT